MGGPSAHYISQMLDDRLEGIMADVDRLCTEAFALGNNELATVLYRLGGRLDQCRQIVRGEDVNG